MKASTIFIVSVIMVVVSMNIMCADLSPQHAEFLDVFFVQFPKALIHNWFSIIF